MNGGGLDNFDLNNTQFVGPPFSSGTSVLPSRTRWLIYGLTYGRIATSAS